MVQPHQAKSERDSDVAFLGALIISSSPTTPGESERGVNFQLGSVTKSEKQKKKEKKSLSFLLGEA